MPVKFPLYIFTPRSGVLICVFTALFGLSSCRLFRGNRQQKPRATVFKARAVQLPDNDNLLLGMPAPATTDTVDKEHFLMRKKAYALSYNSRSGTPNWVSWHLEKADLGTTGRAGKFHPDTTLPSGFYRVKPSDYVRSGFDRGHNCPSGDRTSTTEVNSETFLMTNMVPQAPNNNRITWGHLEDYIRGLIAGNNEAYIMMGNYGRGGLGSKDSSLTIAQGKIGVPQRIWKVAVIISLGDNDLSRIDTSARIIAVDTPNSQGLDHDWRTYITTIHRINSIGGYNMLSAIPDSIRRVLDLKRYTGN